MSEFYVGQRVVCKRCVSHPIELRPGGAVKNGVTYTVREVDHRAAHLHGGISTLRVVEIILPTKHTTIGPWESGFAICCFHPLESKAMSIFRAIAADPSRKLEDA